MRDLLTVETPWKRPKWSDKLQSLTLSARLAGSIKFQKWLKRGLGLINKNPPPAYLYLFGHRGALAKPIWRYQDPLKWNCKGQSLSLTCWLHYVQLCTSRDSRLHHDADIEVELKGSDLTQIHAEPELSSKNWVQTFFKHFSCMELFLSGKEGNYSQRKQWSRW